MSEHAARITWHRNGSVFIDRKYSRVHEWAFDGGGKVAASASPHVVPTPFSDPTLVDPEEAFVASLSSCHMLWFLHIAAQRGFVVDEYTDNAVGVMGKNAEGKMAIVKVTLRPHAAFSGSRRPDPEEIRAMHDLAHHECFIANSVTTEIICQPIFD